MRRRGQTGQMPLVEIMPPAGTPQASLLAGLLANTMVDALPARARVWWAESWLNANAVTLLRDELEFALNEVDLQRFAASCPVDGAGPRDYRNRLLVGDDDLVLLAGIRFRNLNLSQPFVDIVAASRPFSNAWECDRCKDEIAQAFAVFAPLFIRLERSLIGEGLLVKADPGKILMAAPSEVMLTMARPLPAGVCLQATQVSEIYDWYQAAYGRFAARRPDLVPHVRQESSDDLRAAQDAKALFTIELDGQSIGLIGAYESQEGPICGLCINEFMLDDPYRGNSLAVAAQREFARLVSHTGPRAIYGMIHPLNKPALAVAEKLGRQAVAQQMWSRLR